MTVLCLAVALAPALAAAPSSPRLLVTSDRGTFRIGEPVRLAVEVVAPAGVEVELPGEAADLGPFELLGRELVAPDSLAGGEVRHAIRLAVTAYETGSATLPPLTALLRTAAGAVRTIQSDSLTLGIESVLPAAAADSADIRPLRGQIEMRGGHRWWILAAVLAALAALAAIILVRRRRRREPAVVALARDPRPAHLVALEALEALRREQLAAAGRVKEHYIRLTDILRPYLERRFGIPALDLTTGEILTAIGVDGSRAAAIGELEHLLEEADLVKFARATPAAALAEGAIDRAADYVRATASHLPAPAASPDGPAASLPAAVAEGGSSDDGGSR